MGGRLIYVVAACLGAFAAALMWAPAASAEDHVVLLDQGGARGGSSIHVSAGDSVTFKRGAATNPAITPGFYVVLQANPSAGLFSNHVLKNSATATIVFPSAGGPWVFTWKNYNDLGIRISGSPSASVQAAAVDPGTPDPPPSSDPVDPGNPSDPGNPTGGGSTTATASGTGHPSGSGLPGGSSSAGSRPGFSFGPHPDTGRVTSGSSSASGSSSGGVPSASTSDTVTPYVTTSVLPAQQLSDSGGGDPPAPLAIVSIVAFAGVGVAFAFQQFGPHAARSPR